MDRYTDVIAARNPSLYATNAATFDTKSGRDHSLDIGRVSVQIVVKCLSLLGIYDLGEDIVIIAQGLTE